jgi:hypothetical protein
VLSIAILSLCALSQDIIEPTPVSSHEQHLVELLDKASSTNAASELRAELRQLNADWPVLPSRLLEATLLAQPENNSEIIAAIRLSGELGSTNPELLNRLVVLLDSRQFAAVSRSALAQICGREFADSDAFDVWYESASSDGREVWLETVLQQQWQQQEQQWQQRLGQNPSLPVISFAMQHQRRAVRELAFNSLANLDVDSLEQLDLALATSAYITAVEIERDLQLRVLLLQQATRFVEGREALNLLVKAIEQGKPVEATEASRQLAFIVPNDFAWQALLRSIDSCYATVDEQPAGNPVENTTRLALWTGFSTLSSRPQDVKQSQVDLLLQRGFSQEFDPAILEKIYVCTGRQASVEFLPILEAVVFDKNVDASHRSAALLSMTNVAERSPDPMFLSKLVIGLLDDSEKQVRAQSIDSLRRINAEGVFELLADRLSQETQVVLQKQLLGALVEQRSPAIVAKLLEFVPSVELAEAYTRALVIQIGGDLNLLQQAVAALQPRTAYKTALLLVRGFPTENIDVENRAVLDQLHATMLAEQLLSEGFNEANEAIFDDAVLRLRDLLLTNPPQANLTVYLIKLQLARDQVQEAMSQIVALALSDATAVTAWTIALDTMSAAVAAEIEGAINQIRVDMVDAGPLPAELEFRASQLFDPSLPIELRDDDTGQDQGTTE